MAEGSWKGGRLMLKRKKLPHLVDARIALSHVVEYYTMRARNGDPFFNQSMVDDVAAVKAGLAALDVLQEGGWDTGIREAERVMAKTWKRARSNPKHEYGWEPFKVGV